MSTEERQLLSTQYSALSTLENGKEITGYISFRFRQARLIRHAIGPALGQHGVNIMEFCKAFNAKTAQMDPDLKIPVGYGFADRSLRLRRRHRPQPICSRRPPGC